MSLTTAANGAVFSATEPVASELSTKDDTFLHNETKESTCPLKLFTDLLQELGATKEKLQATETRLKALETSQQELMSRLAISEALFPRNDLLQERRATKEKLQSTETRLKALETSQQELMSRLAISEALFPRNDKPKVTFSTSLGIKGTFGPFNVDSTVVYKNVFINVGNAYHKATGIFIAPVRGSYYFSFFYHCSPFHGTALALYRNGKSEAVTGQPKSSGPPANGGNGLILLLEKGDQVYIVLKKDKWIWDEDNITVFSGFLIDAM